MLLTSSNGLVDGGSALLHLRLVPERFTHTVIPQSHLLKPVLEMSVFQQMSGVQCGPDNVNMVKTFCMYLFVTWELMLGRCCHWCSVLPLPYAGGHKVKIRRESRVEVYHGDEAEPRAACTLQFSSVTQSCPTPCNPMDCSTPDLPVHHQLPEFTQTHVH